MIVAFIPSRAIQPLARLDFNDFSAQHRQETPVKGPAHNDERSTASGETLGEGYCDVADGDMLRIIKRVVIRKGNSRIGDLGLDHGG